MGEFMGGMFKVTAVFAVLIFGMLLGSTATEKDMERNCKKDGHYKTVFGPTIECETSHVEAPHKEVHSHKH